MYHNTYLALSVTVAATYNSCFKYITEKRGVINKQDNTRPVNKNYVKVNNFWEHDRFNHLIEHLIAALDRYDSVYRTFAQ